WRCAAVGEQRIDVGRGGHARRERRLRSEFSSRDEVLQVCLFVRIELGLPITLAHNHAIANLMLIAQEDGIARSTLGTAKSRLVGADNEISCLAKLNRQEECRGHC